MKFIYSILNYTHNCLSYRWAEICLFRIGICKLVEGHKVSRGKNKNLSKDMSDNTDNEPDLTEEEIKQLDGRIKSLDKKL
jgi:hypothetical protein